MCRFVDGTENANLVKKLKMRRMSKIFEAMMSMSRSDWLTSPKPTLPSTADHTNHLCLSMKDAHIDSCWEPVTKQPLA